MSRWHSDRNDASGWKKGAGPYSRSYLKTESPSPLKLYKDDDHPHGKDVFERVEGSVSQRDETRSVSMRPFGGLSREVSKGRRPPHRGKDVKKNWGIDRGNKSGGRDYN